MKYTVQKGVHINDLEKTLNQLKTELVQILDGGANYWHLVSRKEISHEGERPEAPMEAPKGRTRKGKEP